jgi:hypothetical protein
MNRRTTALSSKTSANDHTRLATTLGERQAKPPNKITIPIKAIQPRIVRIFICAVGI